MHGASLMNTYPPEPATRWAPYVDHTWLPALGGHSSDQPDAYTQVTQVCDEAKRYGFAAVCVRPQHLSLARQALGVVSPVALATIIGFPDKPLTLAEQRHYPLIGACETTTKLQEIAQSLSEGADELDVVLNVGYYLTDCETGGSFTTMELNALAQAADTVPIKLIIEVDCLTAEQIVHCSQLAAQCGMAMVKTSTGYLSDGQGATVEAVSLIRQGLVTAAGQGVAHAQTMGIKASGGIRTVEQIEALIAAGATRIGSSRCAALAEAALG
jgi:deoxyribose-phosphate aldolase